MADRLSIPAAIAALQAQRLGVARSAEGQVGRDTYHYATLAGILDVIHEHLAPHGIAFTQQVSVDPSDTPPVFLVRVESRFTQDDAAVTFVTNLPVTGYSSRAKDASVTEAPTPQEAGSAITYARKYAALAAVGLAQEDDDGRAASSPAPDAGQTRAAPKPAQQNAPTTDAEGNPIGSWMKSSEEGSENQYHVSILNGEAGKRVTVRSMKGTTRDVILSRRVGNSFDGKSEWDWSPVSAPNGQ